MTSMDIKLSKAQFSKIIQLGGFLLRTLGHAIGNVGKKALLDLAVALAKDILPNVATKATSSVLDKFKEK